jgi:hypothetical protein
MDLNMMMRDQARNGLQSQLDAAVTAGDAATARKIADDIAKLDVATAPKPAVAFTNNDVWLAAEAKAPWLGVDPKKSAKANEFAKTMNPKKFASAEAMADAVIKAVDEEFKPSGTTTTAPPENETDEDREARETAEAEAAEAKAAAGKQRATDGPKDGDLSRGTAARARSGPWTKLADAPADIQKDVKRSADRFVPEGAAKEVREKFITDALASQYRMHQNNKGKK